VAQVEGPEFKPVPQKKKKKKIWFGRGMVVHTYNLSYRWKDSGSRPYTGIEEVRGSYLKKSSGYGGKCL
jgi:hypothetical protein